MPLSSVTGKCTMISRDGERSTFHSPSSRFNLRAAKSKRAFCASQGLISWSSVTLVDPVAIKFSISCRASGSSLAGKLPVHQAYRCGVQSVRFPGPWPFPNPLRRSMLRGVGSGEYTPQTQTSVSLGSKPVPVKVSRTSVTNPSRASSHCAPRLASWVPNRALIERLKREHLRNCGIPRAVTLKL